MTSSIIMIVGCLFLGIAYQILPRVPSPALIRAWIGRVVLWLLLPALAFRALWSASATETTVWQVPLIAATCCVACLLLAWLFYRHRLERRTLGAMLYASAWSNVTYLGIPIITAIVGSHAVRYAVLYDVMALTPLLFTVGAAIGIVYGDKGHRPTVGAMLMQLVTLPPLIAAAVGLVAGHAQLWLPSVVVGILDVASALVAPLMLVSVGMALRVPRASAFARSAPAAIITLVVSPCLAWILARYVVHLPLEVATAVTLEAGMPSMILPMVFAERYGLDLQALAEAIVITTAISAITLPVIATLAGAL